MTNVLTLLIALSSFVLLGFVSPDPVELSAGSAATACPYSVAVSADNIQISDDCEPGGLANTCCDYWDVTVTIKWPFPETECSTGGEFQCDDEGCGDDDVGDN